jgi:hypothetical protein
MEIFRAITLVIVLFLSGCITQEAQRERRISQNIDLFYEFPEEAREMIRRGEVDIGFDEDMVDIALGRPDSISRRKDGEGESVIWQYFRSIMRTDYETVRMPVTYVDKKGHSRIRYEWVTVDHDYWEKQLRMQVEFANGKVSAVETIEGGY